MVGVILGFVIGVGMNGAAVAAWTSEVIVGWAWRNQPKRFGRGPFRLRTLSETRSGLRAAAVVVALGGALLIFAAIASVA